MLLEEYLIVDLLRTRHFFQWIIFWLKPRSVCNIFDHLHIPAECIRCFCLGRPSSFQVVFYPKIWNQKLSYWRHWDYAHAVLQMEWPQPLTYGAPYSTNTKHNLLLQPKEKEVYAFHGQGILPSLSVIYSSSQQHHFCCGVYGTECSIRIPSDSQQIWKYPLI